MGYPRVPLTLSLESYLWAAAEAVNDHYDADVPQNPMFPFARYLKARPELAHLECGDDLVEEVCGWLGEDSYDETLGEVFPTIAGDLPELLSRAWEVVAIPGYGTMLDYARDLAELTPIRLNRTFTEGYERFVATAVCLQRILPGQPIGVSTEAFGRVLGVSPKMITNYRNRAEKHGLLEIVQSATNGCAAMATVHVELFSETMQQIAAGKEMPSKRILAANKRSLRRGTINRLSSTRVYRDVMDSTDGTPDKDEKDERVSTASAMQKKNAKDPDLLPSEGIESLIKSKMPEPSVLNNLEKMNERRNYLKKQAAELQKRSGTVSTVS